MIICLGGISIQFFHWLFIEIVDETWRSVELRPKPVNLHSFRGQFCPINCNFDYLR